MKNWVRHWVGPVLFVVGGFCVGCTDPTASQTRSDLGPEDPNVPPGPNHRPGQPCLVCHDGSTALEFSIGGTLYTAPFESSDLTMPLDPSTPIRQPLTDGVITIVDANGASFWTQANCVGNFFVVPTEYAPVYPFSVSVAYDSIYTPMESVVHRDGSCASCHKDPVSKGSPGPVFLTSTPPFPTVRACK